jgi:hypothetical protein
VTATPRTSSGYRLTGADELAIRTVIQRAVIAWQRAGRTVGPEAMLRHAAHTIGCTVAELSDAEQSWVRVELQTAIDAVGTDPPDVDRLRATVRRLVREWDATTDRDRHLVIGARMVIAAEALERAL